MAYACDICSKGKQFGNNVPFSQKKTRKVWKPNLQRHTLNLGTGNVQVKICTSCIRTLKKYEQEALAKANAEAEASTKAPAEATA